MQNLNTKEGPEGIINKITNEIIETFRIINDEMIKEFKKYCKDKLVDEDLIYRRLT